MMFEPGRKDKFREGQVKIKEIIGIKTKAWRERDRDISSPSKIVM